MKIPKILFGTGKEVHRPVGSWMAKVKKNGQWPDIEKGEFLETKEMARPGSGIRIMFDIDASYGAEEHFRPYSPSRYFKWTLGNRPVGEMENILFFDGLVESTWGLLCLLPVGSYIPTIKMDQGRCIRFFERLVEDWELFLDERHLFFRSDRGMDIGNYFWNRNENKLWSAMVGGGVPIELMQNPNMHLVDDYQAVRWIKEYIL